MSFRTLPLDALRARHSNKWNRFDSDVIPAWVAVRLDGAETVVVALTLLLPGISQTQPVFLNVFTR